jgi:hypothetical protein
MSEDLFNEIMGFTVDPHRIQQTSMNQPQQGYIAPTTMQQHDRQDFGIEFSHCATMEPWQRRISDVLKHGKDVYVVAAPGGGKTLPVFCHWTNNILNLNTMMTGPANDKAYTECVKNIFLEPNKIPKILFLVPTRSLAMQTEQEVRAVFGDIISQTMNRFLKVTQFEESIDSETFGPSAPGHYTPHDAAQRAYNNNLQRQIFEKLGNSNLIMMMTEIARLAEERRSATNDYEKSRIRNIIDSYKRQFKQELIESLRNYMNGNLLRVKTGDYNIDGNNALVHISIYESAVNIVNNMSNLGLIIIDEAHLIQKSGEIGDESRNRQIAEALYTVLHKLKGSKTNIVLLSGTEHPESAQEIIKYLNHCFGRNFEKSDALIQSSSGNRSQLSIVPDDSLMNDSKLVDIVVNAVRKKDWGELIVLFSARKIVKIAEEAIKKLGTRDLKTVNTNVQYGHQFTSIYGNIEKQAPSMSISRNDAHAISQPKPELSDASNIKDPLLRACVSAGFGFYFRNMPDGGGEVSDNDKFIVSKLFKDKKIHAMLATDGVGIGVNIDVKRIYIPRIEKFEAIIGDNKEIPLRDLAQILNRAGRGKIPFASIFTPSGNVEMVRSALSATAEQFNVVPAYSKIGFGMICHKFEAFYSMWKEMSVKF